MSHLHWPATVFIYDDSEEIGVVEDSITHNPTLLPDDGDTSAPPASPVPDLVTSLFSFEDELLDDADCTPPSHPTALLLYLLQSPQSMDPILDFADQNCELILIILTSIASITFASKALRSTLI